ncbi:MAG: thermonuclease family protein [Actinomycetota bacterium]|nr:thermonuclease family protein [Actinomycetota bacterium]
MSRPARWWVVVIAAAGAFISGATGCDRGRRVTEDPPGTGVVELVVDGDTIDVRIDGHLERIRLIGIDTPEMATPDHPAECYGPEASRHTEQLLAPGTKVRLVRDVVGRDDYGRLLAYVFRVDDGLFVNERIVADGFAQPLNIAPNSANHRRFVDAAGVAERSSLGLWSACTS